MAKKRTNVIPIIEDARHPSKYRMLHSKIRRTALILLSQLRLFAQKVKKLQVEQFKQSEQVTLEPFELDRAGVIVGYRMPKKEKPTA